MDRNRFYITDYVKIKHGGLYQNNKLVYNSGTGKDVNEFMRDAYKFLKINYPKFHKMDSLSKLGIIASEILFRNKELSEDTALVFSNSASSLESDKSHSEAMENLVSPSVFVYTLPNIVLGEISIKFGLKGENIFFLDRAFNPDLLADYAATLLELEKCNELVCAWINLENGEYDVFLSLISKKGKLPFSSENLKKLYHFENE